MSGIQQKISSHVKMKENTTHKEEKNQLLASDTELTRVSELVVKDIKILIDAVFHMHKKLHRDIEEMEKDLNST